MFPLDYDFVDTTLKIVKDLIAKPKEERHPYHVTLLTNCLLGLIVFPKENALGAIEPRPLKDLKGWGVEPSHITLECQSDKCRQHKGGNTPRHVVYHLRNAVAHAGVHPWGETEKEITLVKFVDWPPEAEDPVFKAEIPVSALEIFAVKVAEQYKPSLKASRR